MGSFGTGARFNVANPESFDDLRIHFGGADYYAEAWLNGQYLGGNQSALLPFAFDARKQLKPGENKLVVRVIDACYAKEIDGFLLGNVPGGRQHDNPWEPGFRHYNYGGLLLPVSVQGFHRPWIADAFIKPNIEEESIDVDLILVGNEGAEWAATVQPKGRVCRLNPQDNSYPSRFFIRRFVLAESHGAPSVGRLGTVPL